MANEHTSFSQRPAQSPQPRDAAKVVRDDSVLVGALGFVAVLSGGKMKYVITNIYKYTATVEVEAESQKEALEIALGRSDEPNNDDWLYDSTVAEVDE